MVKIFDEDINTQITPDHVYFITSGILFEQAKQYLEEQLEKENRNILSLSKERISELYFRHGLPIIGQEEILKFIEGKED